MAELIDEIELAGMLKVQRQTIQKWRLIGEGPKYVKCSGRVVRYRLKDVHNFLKRRTRQSTKDE
jgi:predicted DNA-binding transcriptional regulator AlpA